MVRFRFGMTALLFIRQVPYIIRDAGWCLSEFTIALLDSPCSITRAYWLAACLSKLR